MNADKAQNGSGLLILDTDPGIDDAMALFFLRAQPSIHLHSVTTVFGNSDIVTTTRNARYLVDRFAIDVPVIAGAAEPLRGKRHIPALKVHGNDGLGDSGLARGVMPRPHETPAWRHICETVRQHPGEVTLLSIGPLTNLALALCNDPHIARLVREVVVMGGAFGTKGRQGNITPHAEANFYYDPDAADAVLAANWPVTLVGLDVTSDCILSTDRAREMDRNGGEIGHFLWQISRGYAAIYRDFDGIDGFCIHDVAAAAYVVQPEWFQCEAGSLTVTTTGSERGASSIDCDEKRPSKRYCVAVDEKQVVGAFYDTILHQVAGAGSS